MKEVVGEDSLLHCSKCGERIEKIVEFPTLDGGKKIPKKVSVMCRCRREEKEAYEKRMQFEEQQRRIDSLQKLSLMDARLKEVRFSTYNLTEDNSKAFEIAKKYVKNFDEMYEKGQGILFWGDVGTGKSYTAAVIANELLQRMYPVIMTSFIKLLKEIGNFDKEDDAYIERLNKAKLLVIDDLGAERGTEYALEKVYDIIDSRYRTGKPIILTTNLSLNHMKNCEDIKYNRIYDRIFEMCYPVKLDGRSWRKKEAVARFEEMKKLLEV